MLEDGLEILIADSFLSQEVKMILENPIKGSFTVGLTRRGGGGCSNTFMFDLFSVSGLNRDHFHDER